MADIIIYLVDYKYVGESEYTDIVFDFRSEKDYLNFCTELNLENGLNNDNERNFLIQISNIKSPKRLRRDSYYKLNLPLFKELNSQSQGMPDSALVAYNFEFNNSIDRENYILFDSHSPLDPMEIYPAHNNRERIQLPDPITNGKIRINDVGQANHNEVIDGEYVVVVYDMGAPLHLTKNEVRTLIDNRIDEYAQSQPILIISHWDYDHILQLKYLSANELSYFSEVYCPQKTKSATSQAILNKIRSAVPDNKIHIMVSNPRTGKNYPLMKMLVRNKSFSLYMGEDSRNINYCGLLLFVHGTSANAMLTGDCILAQASDVLSNESSAITGNNIHKLVVPHHGGDYSYKTSIYRSYRIPPNIIGDTAIYSFGNNNSYGHPSAAVEGLLNKCFSNVKRTAYAGTIIENI